MQGAGAHGRSMLTGHWPQMWLWPAKSVRVLWESSYLRRRAMGHEYMLHQGPLRAMLPFSMGNVQARGGWRSRESRLRKRTSSTSPWCDTSDDAQGLKK